MQLHDDNAGKNKAEIGLFVRMKFCGRTKRLGLCAFLVSTCTSILGFLCSVQYCLFLYVVAWFQQIFFAKQINKSETT